MDDQNQNPKSALDPENETAREVFTSLVTPKNRSNLEGIIASVEEIVFRKAVLGVVPIAFTIHPRVNSDANRTIWHPTAWWMHSDLQSIRFSDNSVVMVNKPGDSRRLSNDDGSDEASLAKELANRLRNASIGSSGVGGDAGGNGR